MNPGSLVEYLQGKELAVAFCLGPENKNKLPIMTSSGRKESLAAKKVVFHHSTPLSPTAVREDVLAHLASTEEKKSQQAQALDTGELWELLCEEEPGREWTLSELSEYLFAEDVGVWEKSVLYRALLADKHRYSRKGDHFVTRTAEQVEEAVQREIVEAQREAQREAVKLWLRQVWDTQEGRVSGPHSEIIEEWKGRIRDTAISGEDSSHFQHVQRYLKELDGKSRDVAFQFMVRLKEWDQDQNVEILANQTPTIFSPEVMADAELAQQHLSQVLEQQDREDYIDWECHSIDDPDTTEIDDALAWRATDDGYELAIHIADASALVRPDFENLEREIRYRATSVYLPDFKVRMVPENLSDDALSLKAGEVRPAFTFLAQVNHDGKLMSARMLCTKIKVAERLDYHTADGFVAEGTEYWKTFYQIAEHLKAQREANGAVNLPFPRMNVELDGKSIRLVPDERDSVSQTIVSEMMILANRIAAEYLSKHDLPAIYRSQKAPDPPIEDRPEWKPHHLYEARRSFSRSAQGFEPAHHSGLGLDCYVQATSPIRRYRDLILQRQIKHHLRTGDTLYDREALEEILTVTSTPVSQAEKMERNRKGYFLHKLLKAQRGQEVEAVILAATAERYTLQLKETLREVDVPQGGGPLRAPGESVRVRIISVYPRDRVIKVSSPL
jgi:exoribonuclease II